MNGWHLIWLKNRLYQIVNQTGHAAYNVNMSTKGAVVVGMLGKSNWHESFEEVPHGTGPDRVITQGWGDPGFILISWDSPAGERLTTELPVR